MLRIGTSGFHYEHWRDRYYPASVPRSRWLECYARDFATVELNAPFYRLPGKRTFSEWAARVPGDFTFAVKASRYLTHVRRLHDPEEPVERLMDRCAALGERLGPVLVQLPPDLPFDADGLDRTLGAFPKDTLVAVEPRHQSWFVPACRSLLEGHRAMLCLADRRGPITPLWRTARTLYLRFHHGRGTPQPCYTEDELREWVSRIRDTHGARPEGWVYFNNDPRGCAVRDAAVLGRLAREAGMTVSRMPAVSVVSVD
jgi:uncharacterized protein YecE (DUF72 family)